MISHATEGLSVPAIAKQVHVHEQIVRLWLNRFTSAGLPAMQAGPRPGRPATYSRKRSGSDYDGADMALAFLHETQQIEA